MTLKELRTSRGMTLAQIAETLGVPTATYHRWESGKYHPSADSMIKISEAMEVDVKISFATGEISYENPVRDTKEYNHPSQVVDAALRFAAEVQGIYEEE